MDKYMSAFLLSVLISLCKQCCVRGISLFLDVRVNFAFMPRFPETHTENDTHTHTHYAHADSESQTVKTPLMKQAKKPLMLYDF